MHNVSCAKYSSYCLTTWGFVVSCVCYSFVLSALPVLFVRSTCSFLACTSLVFETCDLTRLNLKDDILVVLSVKLNGLFFGFVRFRDLTRT